MFRYRREASVAKRIRRLWQEPPPKSGPDKGKASKSQSDRGAAILTAPGDERGASDPFPGATPIGVAFLICRLFSSLHAQIQAAVNDSASTADLHRSVTCQPEPFAVVSEVPSKRLKRSPRLGESRLAAEQQTSPHGPFPFPRLARRQLKQKGHHLRKARAAL